MLPMFGTGFVLETAYGAGAINYVLLPRTSEYFWEVLHVRISPLNYIRDCLTYKGLYVVKYYPMSHLWSRWGVCLQARGVLDDDLLQQSLSLAFPQYCPHAARDV